jgi:hypothetical protein
MAFKLRLLANSRINVAPGLQNRRNLLQCPLRFDQVVQRADHGGGIEDLPSEGQAIDIGGDINEARLLPQSLTGLLQLGQRVIQQENLPIPPIARRVAPGPRPKLQQPLSSLGGEKAAQGDGLHAILILAAALLPKRFLIIRTFVIADGQTFQFQLPPWVLPRPMPR